MRRKLLNLMAGLALAVSVVNLLMARSALKLLAASLAHACAIPELGLRAAQFR